MAKNNTTRSISLPTELMDWIDRQAVINHRNRSLQIQYYLTRIRAAERAKEVEHAG